jgi:Fe-S cluster biosynthesis and repair protein YggX
MWQELSKEQWKKWAKANKKLIVFLENSVIDLT